MWSLVPTPDLQAQTPFYRGKTVTIIVGSAAGTVYDIYARLMGRYVGKYLPGTPEVIVQNMPAAGSLVAANYIYGIAKPDAQTPDAARRLSSVILASGEFGRPLVTSPGVPTDRVKHLRDGFMKAMADPALLSEAEKQKIEITPTSGEELATLAKDVMSQPPAVIERMKKILGE